MQKDILNLNEKFSIEMIQNNWIFLKIHIGLMIIELTIVSITCLIFYLIFKRNIMTERRIINKNADKNNENTQSTTLKLMNNNDNIIMKQKLVNNSLIFSLKLNLNLIFNVFFSIVLSHWVILNLDRTLIFVLKIQQS